MKRYCRLTCTQITTINKSSNSFICQKWNKPCTPDHFSLCWDEIALIQDIEIDLKYFQRRK